MALLINVAIAALVLPASCQPPPGIPTWAIPPPEAPEQKPVEVPSYANKFLPVEVPTYVITAAAPAGAEPPAAPAAAGSRPSGVSASSSNKIGAVVATLKDILESVKHEEKEETAANERYVEWCTKQQKQNADDIVETKSELADAKVLFEAQASELVTLKFKVHKAEKETATLTEDIDKMTRLRKEDHDEFAEEFRLNAQSLRQIAQAIERVSKIKKSGGFLQNGVIAQFQINKGGESNFALGILKGMQEKLINTRDVLKSVEDDHAKSHDELLATKNENLAALSSVESDAKIALSETEAKHAWQQKLISQRTDDLKQLQEYATQTTDGCETTAYEWKVKQADRQNEKGALAQAIRYLAETALEQEQVSYAQVSSVGKDAEIAPVGFSPLFLQVASVSKTSDLEYAAAAGALISSDEEKNLRKGSFGVVQKEIDRLITAHQDDQVQEDEKKAYCEQHLAERDEDKAQIEEDLGVLKAEIQKKSSEVETLETEIEEFDKMLEETNKGLDEAYKVRKEEKALYEAGAKDRALAIKVLQQAKKVLQSFYSFAEMQDTGFPTPPPKDFAKKKQKKKGGFGAVMMIEGIKDDIKQEEKDALLAEKDATSAYGELMQASQVKIDNAVQGRTDCTMGKAKLNVQINDATEREVQKNDELEATNTELASLHESCDELLKHYDDRVHARSFEVSQMKDVIDILKGSSMESMRTALIKTGSKEVEVKAAVGATADSEAGAKADSKTGHYRMPVWK